MSTDNNHLTLDIEVDTSLEEPDMHQKKDDRHKRTHDAMKVLMNGLYFLLMTIEIVATYSQWQPHAILLKSFCICITLLICVSKIAYNFALFYLER